MELLKNNTKIFLKSKIIAVRYASVTRITLKNG